MNPDSNTSPALQGALEQLLEGRLSPESRSLLEQSLEETPAFALAEVLLLKHFGSSLDAKSVERLRARVALSAGDRTAVIGFAGPEALDFRMFYPPEKKAPRMSTDRALDVYRSKFSPDAAAEDALLEKLIFNPVADYSVTLEQQERQMAPETKMPDTPHKTESTKSPEHSKNPEPSFAPEFPRLAVPQNTPPQPEDTQNQSLLSESLAKFYIKQGRFASAYEIISQLNLKYPKKSVYFADQLRYLRKLMQIQEYRNG